MKNNLRFLRRQKGWTQDKLAKCLGTSNHSISSYEIGKRDIPNDLLVKLADIFDVSVDYLLNRGMELHEDGGEYKTNRDIIFERLMEYPQIYMYLLDSKPEDIRKLAQFLSSVQNKG